MRSRLALRPPAPEGCLLGRMPDLRCRLAWAMVGEKRGNALSFGVLKRPDDAWAKSLASEGIEV